MIWLYNNAGNYFFKKLQRINGLLNATQSSEALDGDDNASSDNMGACADCVVPDPRDCAEFPNFKALTQDRVCWITGKAGMKSCPKFPDFLS